MLSIACDDPGEALVLESVEPAPARGWLARLAGWLGRPFLTRRLEQSLRGEIGTAPGPWAVRRWEIREGLLRLVCRHRWGCEAEVAIPAPAIGRLLVEGTAEGLRWGVTHRATGVERGPTAAIDVVGASGLAERLDLAGRIGGALGATHRRWRARPDEAGSFAMELGWSAPEGPAGYRARAETEVEPLPPVREPAASMPQGGARRAYGARPPSPARPAVAPRAPSPTAFRLVDRAHVIALLAAMPAAYRAMSPYLGSKQRWELGGYGASMALTLAVLWRLALRGGADSLRRLLGPLAVTLVSALGGMLAAQRWAEVVLAIGANHLVGAAIAALVHGARLRRGGSRHDWSLFKSVGMFVGVTVVAALVVLFPRAHRPYLESPAYVVCTTLAVLGAAAVYAERVVRGVPQNNRFFITLAAVSAAAPIVVAALG